MKTVEAGTIALFTVDLVRDNGSVINSSTVTFSLKDGLGEEILAPSLPIGFTAGDSTVTISIEAFYNQLSSDLLVSESRLLIVTVVDTDNGETIIIKQPYIVLGAPISFMNGSYQTYQEAELTAYGLPNLESWLDASEPEKVNALTAAFNHLGLLVFYTNGVKIFDLNGLPITFINTLSAEFFARLRRAQVIEANSILCKDPDVENRENGLILKKVGESSNMYRQGKPLIFPVCRRAMVELTGYIDFGVKIGRA